MYFLTFLVNVGLPLFREAAKNISRLVCRMWVSTQLKGAVSMSDRRNGGRLMVAHTHKWGFPLTSDGPAILHPGGRWGVSVSLLILNCTL